MYKLVKRKSSNRNKILECIYRNAPISRTSIAKLTGITPATTTLTIAELLDEGIVCELGLEESADPSCAGRRRISLDICPDFLLSLGVEFNQKALSLSVTDMKGKSLYFYSQPHTPALGKRITEAILEQIDAALHSCGITEDRLAGIGIAIPGHINAASSKLASNNNTWDSLDIAKIRSSFSVPVLFENNVRCMALSQYLFHPEITPDSFAFFHVGLGMFCANMMDGHLFLGNSYVSGEIGHTIVNPNGLSCECGKQGCLQTIASEQRFIHNAQKLYKTEPDGILRHLVASPEAITMDTIAAAYSMGDEAVTACVTHGLRYLGISTSNIAILMNPGKIFLHGAIFTYPEIQVELMNIIRQQLSFVESSHVESIEILPCGVQDGSIGGSALAILEGFLEVSYDQG